MSQFCFEPRGYIAMAKSPSTVRVTNDPLAKLIEDTGKRLIEASMSLRSGFDVPVEYKQDAVHGALRLHRIAVGTEVGTWSCSCGIEGDTGFNGSSRHQAKKVMRALAGRTSSSLETP